MYAIKVRPPTATAWFWLRRGNKGKHGIAVRGKMYGLTTYQSRAVLFGEQDAADMVADLTAPRGVFSEWIDARAVRIGNGIHL